MKQVEKFCTAYVKLIGLCHVCIQVLKEETKLSGTLLDSGTTKHHGYHQLAKFFKFQELEMGHQSVKCMHIPKFYHEGN